MRAIWSGQITFGLVNVPVKLYSATQNHDVAFHQVHDVDGGRIRYERHCDVCGEAVEYGHIAKAYDDGKQTVVLSDDELASLPAEEKDEIEVVQFVPGDQIDPVTLGSPYYLEPVGKSPKSYVLLRQTLRDADRTAIVRFTLRSKTRLGVLRARDDVLVLQTLLWDEDVRQPDFPAIDAKVTVSDKELKMASVLVEQYSDDFKPSDFHDDYQEELRQLIDAKLAEGDGVDTEATFGERSDDAEGGGKVLSLLDALEGSLKKRAAAAEAPAEADEAEAKPAKKAAAKKAAPRKKSA